MTMKHPKRWALLLPTALLALAACTGTSDGSTSTTSGVDYNDPVQLAAATTSSADAKLASDGTGGTVTSMICIQTATAGAFMCNGTASDGSSATVAADGQSWVTANQ